MPGSLQPLVRRHGVAGGALLRLRAALDLADVDERTVHAHGESLATAERELAAARAQLSALQERIAALEGDAARQQAPRSELGVVSVEELFTAEAMLRGLPPVGEAALVSVVIATRGRPAHLTRALRSVLAQEHAEWEVLVVDDGVEPTAAAVIDALGDARIRLIDAPPGRGASAARNSGLAAARGVAVTYLDDDCTMGACWLAAVGKAFGDDAALEVAYGVRLVEYRGVRSLQLETFDRLALERGNLVDTNVIAHRSGLPEAFWAEELAFAADWDLVARLAADAEPARLPVLAATYDQSSPDRLSERPEARSEYLRVRSMLRERRAGRSS